MIQLYYSPGTIALVPHFLLEELGLPYELVLVDTRKQEHQQAAYLKINPKGKIPFMVDGDLMLSESAAICMYLADSYANLAGANHFSPPLGSPERAYLYQWMLYLSNTLQAELFCYLYPEKLTEEVSATVQVKTRAEQRVAQMLSYIDDHLAASSDVFLLGEQLTIADLLLFLLCRWTRGMQKPARAYPHLTPYLTTLSVRPSISKAFEMEGIQAPFF
jgi:glutathione S-transferase